MHIVNDNLAEKILTQGILGTRKSNLQCRTAHIFKHHSSIPNRINRSEQSCIGNICFDLVERTKESVLIGFVAHHAIWAIWAMLTISSTNPSNLILWPHQDYIIFFSSDSVPFRQCTGNLNRYLFFGKISTLMSKSVTHCCLYLKYQALLTSVKISISLI